MSIPFVILLTLAAQPEAKPDPNRLRVLIETDIGGDADDQASFVRFLLYANEWDVEGIIADRPAATFDKDPVRDHLGLPAKNGHELALAYLKAYGEVRTNLVRHDRDYPTEQDLRKRTVPGHNDTDEGVKLITAAADRDDPRPIWYGNWGSNSGRNEQPAPGARQGQGGTHPGGVQAVRGEVPHRHARRPRPDAAGARRAHPTPRRDRLPHARRDALVPPVPAVDREGRRVRG